MFTFGMFSTHIPYIALVAFYAYFLLFGMEKASKGEITCEAKNPFIYELPVSNQPAIANHSGCFHYHSGDLFSEHAHFEDFIFKREITQRIIKNDNIRQFLFCLTTSNRPPPGLA